MNITIDKLNQLLNSSEDEHLEFKEAKNQIGFDDLEKYCAALANEGGGYLILGVTDKKPRRVIGTSAIKNPQETTHGLHQKLHLKFEIHEINHTDGRVIVVQVPSHLPGMPVNV